MNIRLSSILSATLLCLSVSPAAAQDAAAKASDAPERDARVLAFEIDVMQVHAADPSTESFDDDGVFTGPSIGVVWAPLEALPELRGVFMFQSLASDVQSSDFIDADRLVDVDWSRQRFMLGMDAGTELLGFLRPSARVAAGYSLQQLSTRDGIFTDYTHDIALQGALGLEAFLDLSRLDSSAGSPWDRLRIGMKYQLGVSWQSAATFDEVRDRRDNADTTWQAEDASFGTLDTDGLFWTLGFNIAYAL